PALLGILAEGLRQRAIWEGNVQGLAQEKADVADLAVVQDLFDLGANLCTGLLDGDAFHQAEPMSQKAGEGALAERRAAGAAAIPPETAPPVRGDLGEGSIEHARLADAVRAHDADDAWLPVVTHRLCCTGEHADLLFTSEEERRARHGTNGALGIVHAAEFH